MILFCILDADRKIPPVVKLPPFSKEHPGVYFKQIKAIFAISGITSDEEQFQHFMANLDPVTIPIVSESPEITLMSDIEEKIMLFFDPWAALLGVRRSGFKALL